MILGLILIWAVLYCLFVALRIAYVIVIDILRWAGRNHHG